MWAAFYSLAPILVLATLQGLISLWGGRAFLRFVQRELRTPLGPEGPFTSVILPVKGVDPRLVDTLGALRDQTHARFEVVCAVESATDPAMPVLRRFITENPGFPMRIVVAARDARGCAQKIVNMLAAIAAVRPESEAFAFLDSDAVPPREWLAHLVRPLGDSTVGAATGYRWYVPGRTWDSLVHCVWNAYSLTFLGDHSRNFCWGGSTAILRRRFDELRIATRWQRALSEDFEITRAVNAAGLRVRFVPQCLLPSEEHAGWRSAWSFARRQLIITRVCSPPIWLAAAWMTFIFAAAYWGLLLLAGIALLRSAADVAVASLASVLWLHGLAIGKSVYRQIAVALLVPPPELRRGALAGDALGAPLIGLLNAVLMVASGVSRRFWWRGIHYEMRAIDDIRILRRIEAAPPAPVAAPLAALHDRPPADSP